MGMQPVQTTRRINNDPRSNRIRERFKHLTGDHTAEESAIAEYNAAIELAGGVNDFATRGLLEQILKGKNAHIGVFEALQDQISHMTLGVFN
jgi:bacterioferritin